jgi:NTP pyrophosphatase (non-canonical NTP hydrolase)
MEKLDELLQQIKKFNDVRDWAQFHSPKNLSMSLMVEAAELAEIFQWLSEEESRSLDADKLAMAEEEIADVLIYLLNIVDKLGIDLLAAASRKLEINEEKYPVDKARGSADKYREF